MPEDIEDTFVLACTILDSAMSIVMEEIIKEVIEVKRLTIELVFERQIEHKPILKRLQAIRTELKNLRCKLSETLQNANL